MLTSKERAELRSQATTIDTTLMVGKGGVTEAVIAEAENQLNTRELVKGKVLEGAMMTPREVWYNNPRRFSKVKVIAPNNILFADEKGLLIVEKNRFRITGKFECFYPK